MTETNSTTWMELTGLCDGKSKWWERPWERTSVMNPGIILYKTLSHCVHAELAPDFCRMCWVGGTLDLGTTCCLSNQVKFVVGAEILCSRTFFSLWLFDFNCTLWPDICSKTSNFLMIQAQDMPNWRYS